MSRYNRAEFFFLLFLKKFYLPSGQAISWAALFFFLVLGTDLLQVLSPPREIWTKSGPSLSAMVNRNLLKPFQ